ncbi:hypothetical protein K493DRAFT_267883 [Basidiobolus meristosporus CBS 931.73]|uniref:Iron-binding zinc finger CDGSH type domain-containing protein n=1 Tax=Basidiobolus meristosporus CBS 931.73 TaxID=1314790 RepID=A0A1Y1XTH1_9FUNG|nr:hypothetical protein K493DRAFT_267883 [Basidiobolus meristosporus CBS 931.73]|eukprot:ORX88806.1 hypothetical protein K493DRAFT_267883 [Basidiobolus meristosporus CBS 931.73]
MTPPCQETGADGVVEIEDLALKPCVPMYGPINVCGLVPGQTKLWCTCGLSKKQPWCDASHKGTKFKPLKWVVPGTLADGRSQARYSICNCKYTKAPPYCDAAHTDLPCKYLGQQGECKEDHAAVEKLCEACGYAPVNPYLESQRS